MTRGQESNTAYVVLDGDDNARAMLERTLRRDRAVLGALGVQRQLAHEARVTTQQRQRDLHEEQARLLALGERADQARLAELRSELEPNPREPGVPRIQDEATGIKPCRPRPSLGP
jgi:hypothetical protein